MVRTTLLLPLLAGCTAAATPVVTSAPEPPAYVGLEAVMGRGADVAIALVGPSSLDRREGDARHLQFAGACVLDLYYYPPPGSNAAVARHADARLPDGSAIAPGACLARLQSERKPAG
jgi:hypothetical protein